MKEDKIVLTEKRYRQLEKRRNEIWKLKRALPWKPITPYQDGWVIVIALTDEAYRRKDGERMLEALNLCKSRSYTIRDVKKVAQLRKIEKMSDMKSLFMHRDWQGNITYAGPSLSSITEKKWEEQHPSVKKLFEKNVKKHVSPWGGQETIYVNYTLDIPDHYLVMKIKKRMVTHIQDIDPALIKEEAEIEKELEPYYRTFPHGGCYDDEKNSPKTQRRHIKDALQKIKKGEIEEVEQYNKATKFK